MELLSSDDLQVKIEMRLKSVINDIEVGQVDEALVYANPGGLTLLNDLDDLKTRMTRSERERASSNDESAIMKKELGDVRKEVTSLKSQVNVLKSTSNEYLSIRRRFLEVFQRDVLQDGVPSSATIRAGNNAARAGDAVSDALVFHEDRRSDRRLFRTLYGLDYAQVLEIFFFIFFLLSIECIQSKDYDTKCLRFVCTRNHLFITSCFKLTRYLDSEMDDDGGIFLVLNSHATLKAQGKTISQGLGSAFANFTTKVEQFWLQSPTSDPKSPLGAAYYEFWNHYNGL
jgi:hypothetical protein